MKKAIISLMVLAIAVFLCTCANEPPEPPTDYVELMAESAHNGSVKLGNCAEELRGVKPGEDTYISFDELYLLSRFIQSEYGNFRYSDTLRSFAGEVVLNRMADEDYPDSMEAVIEDMGADMESIKKLECPMRANVKIALRLLSGERETKPTVVIISESPTGNVYASFMEEIIGNTYFCEK